MSPLALAAILIVSSASAVIGLSDEKRLIKYLLENYERVGKVGRPVYNTSNTVQVQFGLALIQILDLDEKNQVLVTNVWNRYLWVDILLKWSPEDFGGVQKVRVPTASIWTPDIILYNYADTRLKVEREAMAVVSNDGTVLWVTPAILMSTCSVDITYFPFDEQTCTFKMGSWTYDGFKLDLSLFDSMPEIDMTDYISSNEWTIKENPATKEVKFYPCCVEPYPSLVFTLRMKRIAVFYNYILILPCILLSFLTLVIFWLPPESSDKVSFGMDIFVAFFLLLLILADATPPAASSVPLIGAYFCLNMIMITLSAFWSVIVTKISLKGEEGAKLPKTIKWVFVDGLACMMGLRQRRTNAGAGSRDTAASTSTPCIKDEEIEMKGAAFCHSSCEKDGINGLAGEIGKIREVLQSYMKAITDKDVRKTGAEEWRTFARVLDRILFIVYLVIIITSLVLFFPKT